MKQKTEKEIAIQNINKYNRNINDYELRIKSLVQNIEEVSNEVETEKNEDLAIIRIDQSKAWRTGNIDLVTFRNTIDYYFDKEYPVKKKAQDFKKENNDFKNIMISAINSLEFEGSNSFLTLDILKEFKKEYILYRKKEIDELNFILKEIKLKLEESSELLKQDSPIKNLIILLIVKLS